MALIAHLWLLQGQRKAVVETRLTIPEESVQWIMKFISGKIVGLILLCGSRVS